MSFQDKYKEYKEKQETKSYFRANNDQFLDSTQWIKTIVIGIFAAIACGIILGIVIYSLSITSSIFYLICGYVISMAVTTISGVHSKQVAILSVILTFLCFVVGEMTWAYLPFHDMGIGLDSILIFDWFIESVKGLFVDDIFTTIVAALGMLIAYQQSQ